MKFKCDVNGCGKVYKDAAHLGIHKRMAHGIKGRKYQPKKLDRWQKAKKVNARLKKTMEEVHAKRSKDTEVYAYAMGKIEDRLIDIATKHDIAPSQFARGFAEYLYNQTRG